MEEDGTANMLGDGPMSYLLWCSHCHEVLDSQDTDLDDAERCPVCGAADDDLIAWRRMRRVNPDWPRCPYPGDHYVSTQLPDQAASASN